MLRELRAVPVIQEILADPLHVRLVPHELANAALALPLAGALGGVDVGGSRPLDLHGEEHVGTAALGLLLCLGRGFLAHLLLGLRLVFEHLLGPTILPQVQQALDLKLNPLRVLFLVVLVRQALQVEQARRELRHQNLALLCVVQCVTDGLEQLADALDHVLLGGRLLDADEVVHDLSDDLNGKQLPKEKVADELHIRKDLVLPLFHLQLEILG
mmetsp:Transcript_18167/g.52467  ORF Transcript_18167/g.52467 Transcript_18167/m.52467 type:complete len:214 (-) Transcript_18167:1056-1697(-)